MLPTILEFTTFGVSSATSLSNVLLRNVNVSIVLMCDGDHHRVRRVLSVPLLGRLEHVVLDHRFRGDVPDSMRHEQPEVRAIAEQRVLDRQALHVTGPQALGMRHRVGRRRVVEVDAVERHVVGARRRADLDRRVVVPRTDAPATDHEVARVADPHPAGDGVHDAGPDELRRARVDVHERRAEVAHRHVMTPDVDVGEGDRRAAGGPEVDGGGAASGDRRDRLRAVVAARHLHDVAGARLPVRVPEAAARCPGTGAGARVRSGRADVPRRGGRQARRRHERARENAETYDGLSQRKTARHAKHAHNPLVVRTAAPARARISSHRWPRRHRCLQPLSAFPIQSRPYRVPGGAPIRGAPEFPLRARGNLHIGLRGWRVTFADRLSAP